MHPRGRGGPHFPQLRKHLDSRIYVNYSSHMAQLNIKLSPEQHLALKTVCLEHDVKLSTMTRVALWMLLGVLKDLPPSEVLEVLNQGQWDATSRLTTSLPPEVLLRVHEAAEARGVTTASWLRELVQREVS